MPITVRPASEADAAAACSVLRRSIRELCAADHGHDEQVLTAWLANKTVDNVRAWITSPSSFSVVIVDEGEVRGFGLIQRDGELQLCYLVPEAQHRGAGALMLGALEEQVARWGVDAVVLTSSVTGRRFYERHGYAQSGPPRSVYGVRAVYPMSKRIRGDHMAAARPATALFDIARALRPGILAARERIEGDRRLPEDLARELARAGFFRIFLPAAYGGLDLTPIAALEVFEELARSDASVAWCVWNGNVHWTTVQLPKDVALEIFADPDLILANSTRATGQATIVDGGYRVAGRWSLVSGCQLSSWFILMCIVHEDGRPRLAPSGAPESRFMFCPASACQIVDTWSVSGLRGTGSHDVVVQDCFVPGRHGSFYTDPIVLPGPRYRFPFLSRVVPGLGAIALGIARGAIEALVDLAGDKRAHERRPQSLRDDRGAQVNLSQAEALIRSARLFLFDAVERLWDVVVAGGEAAVEARAQVRLASWNAATSAAKAVDLAYLTGGATSLYETCPLERAFRDVHAVTQHIGVHPRALEVAGRVLFGLEPEVPPMMV